MDQKTTGIVATVAATLLCGCPGLFGLCFGALTAFVGLVPGSDIDIGGSSDPAAAILTGIGSICIGFIFVLIPVAVGFFTLRKRAPVAAAIDYPDEPLPPAI